MSVYTKVVKSKLNFKGGGGKTNIHLSKRSSSGKSHDGIIIDKSEGAGSSNISGSDSITVEKGIGRITSSGTTIQGHESKFMDQLSVGDAIIIKHPTSMKDETKIVRMVLSNMSISISSAFSTDIISTTSFQYIKAPKDLVMSAEEQETKAIKRKHEEEVAAFGTYASKGGEEIVYRVKKPGAFGGYSIVKETAEEGKSRSREELLDLRSKKKADRFCY